MSGHELPPSPVASSLVRVLLNAALDATIMTDDLGRVVEWNHRAEDVFGWRREEVLGREMESLIIPETYRADYRQGMERFRSTGAGPVLESKLRLTALRRSGEEFPIELSTAAVPDNGRTIVIGHVRELTAQLATEQQLARQKLENELFQQATTLTTQSESFDQALQTCVEILCEVSGWPVGHVFVVNKSGNRLESSRVWHLEDPERFREFRSITESTTIACGEGFAGAIWKSGKPEWTSDIAQWPNLARDLLSFDLNVHAAFGFPVKIDDEIVAVMEFFTSEKITPDPQLLRMVSSIGGQLGRMMERRRLQEDQTRHAAIVDSSTDAIISRSPDGTITSWNEGAERVYGYTEDEAFAGGMALILPSGVRDEDANILAMARDGHRVEQFETRRQTKEGTLISVSVNVSPIVNADGDIVGVSTIERNITELVRTRQQLLESEEHGRLLLESTAEAIYGIDLDGKCTFCNRSCVTMLGYESPEELLGLNMHEVMHHTRPDGTPYRNEECRVFTAFRRNEGSHVDDEVLWRKDGSSFPAEYWSFPILRSNEVVGAVVTFFDISERKQSEEEQARLASVVDSSVDAIIATDTQGVITSWNRGAQQIYGYSTAEAIGRGLDFTLPPGLRAEDSVVLNAIRNGEEVRQIETVRRRKDGRTIDVSITLSPIRTSDGRVVGASSIERDITARRQRQRDLEQARDAAEAANRAKNEFLANISHELRTPMNSIIGMTDLALREELQPDVRDCLVTARDSADTLLFLLNDILDFSRMEAGRFELEPVNFSLRGMMQDTIKSLSLRAHEKGLELACQIDNDVPHWVRGDSLRLRQVITNLVTNALKFTEQGEVMVSISRDGKEDGPVDVGDEFPLHIAVKDTGIGISASDQRRIFAPFTQADASTTRRHAGTGLGLSICRKLTDLMGGRMWLESELNEGSTFHCTAILRVTERGDDEVKRERITVKQLESMPVLIVDDNHSNQRIIAEMLSNWSLIPTVCSDADEAIEAIASAAERDRPFPLIIVDALMPRVDGFMLIERINADPRLKHGTILMLSSADRQLFRDRCSVVPVSSYLEKPVSPSSLLDAIMTALEGPQFATQASETMDLTDRPLRILVAEDTLANQKVITRILGKRGHEVQIAHNGREAIDRIQRDKFDLILMDVQMPTMDGLQATAAIRRHEHETGRHIPIVAMTAHAMRGDREKCLAAGMDDYLSKPINAEKLIRLIESVAASSAAGLLSATVAPAGEKSSKPNETSDGEAVWCPAAALQRLGQDPALLKDMIGYFIEDSPQLLAEIESSIDARDADELVRAAHSLKGLCSNFEARPATMAALSVHQLAENGDVAAAAASVAALRREVNRLGDHLTQWRDDLT